MTHRLRFLSGDASKLLGIKGMYVRYTGLGTSQRSSLVSYNSSVHGGCHMNNHYCAMSTLLSYHSPCPLMMKHILLIFEIGSHHAALDRLCRPGWLPT